MLTQVTDLGILKFGVPHKFSLVVRNGGEREVHLKKLTVGCTSCTKATTHTNVLRPTEQAVINVVFTPGTTGIQRKSITIVHDDGALRLEFVANVQD